MKPSPLSLKPTDGSRSLSRNKTFTSALRSVCANNYTNLSHLYFKKHALYMMICRYALIFALGFSVCQCVYSQSTLSTPRFGTYEGSIDQINVGNLNVTMQIPLYHIHNRGKGMDKDISLNYVNQMGSLGSPIGQYINNYLPNQWSLSQANGYGAAAAWPQFSSNTCGSKFPTQTISTYTYQFTDSRGVKHTFGSTNSNCAGTSDSRTYNTLTNVPATDGSGYLLVYGSGDVMTVADPSGNQYSPYGFQPNPLNTVVDTNGNSSTISNFIEYICPQSTAPTITNASSGNDPVVNHGCYLTSTDPNNPNQTIATSRTPDVISYVDSNGNPQSVTISYQLYNLVLYGFYGQENTSSACSNPASYLHQADIHGE